MCQSPHHTRLVVSAEEEVVLASILTVVLTSGERGRSTVNSTLHPCLRQIAAHALQIDIGADEGHTHLLLYFITVIVSGREIPCLHLSACGQFYHVGQHNATLCERGGSQISVECLLCRTLTLTNVVAVSQCERLCGCVIVEHVVGDDIGIVLCLTSDKANEILLAILVLTNELSRGNCQFVTIESTLDIVLREEVSQAREIDIVAVNSHLHRALHAQSLPARLSVACSFSRQGILNGLNTLRQRDQLHLGSHLTTQCADDTVQLGIASDGHHHLLGRTSPYCLS